MLASPVMLSWFLDHKVKEAVLARKRLVEEEDVGIRPTKFHLRVLKKMYAFKVFRNTSQEMHGVL